MSILIKGMEMPTSCNNCWALDDYGDYPRCRITEEQRGYNFPIREKRMDDCPLIPVPSHGRLIDADELKDLYDLGEELDYCHVKLPVIRLNIDDMPTILEAEVEE